MAASFFEVVGTRSLKLWVPPAGDFLPAIVPIEDCLTRSDHACVAIESVAAWPAGITLTVVVLLREDLAEGESLPQVVRHPAHQEEVSDTSLLFGVVFADGTAATNVDRLEHDRRLTNGPTLNPGTSQAGKRSLRQQVHLQPLPPDGPLTFVVRWLSRGIEETTLRVDSGPFLSAATRARRIW
ncbi:hypothetical protein Q5425_18945 [Amycolatopsis sp. A133]|uniref:hypothetical protein n=1 Tax=Amycolatopsis sp. A133 TaxID=3064472 RepID=UPI0027F01121|nr:hypothetical protein [Amycolatopsis sp. A133]MDQ7805828.1 hypothetical protein [Amycolatopsis sp. A133]